MHDEDNAIGLEVTSPQGSPSWRMFGDKRLLDTVDKTNQNQATKAVQASADEIFQAWSTKEIPTPEKYQAWQYAPTLVSARAATQELAPLFTFEEIPQRRTAIEHRREWSFTLDYWYWSTIVAIVESNLWNYPITIDPPKVLSRGKPKRIGVGF